MLRENLVALCQRHEKYKSVFSVYIHEENINDKERDKIFSLLYNLLFESSSAQDVAECFVQYLPLLLCKLMNFSGQSFAQNHEIKRLHRFYCVILGNLVQVNDNIKSFVINYFDQNPAPFESLDVEESKPKKRKIEFVQKSKNVTDHEIVVSTYRILKALPKHFRSKWNWSKFYKYLVIDNDETKWVALKTIKIVFNMSQLLFSQYASSLITNHERFYTTEESDRKGYIFCTSETDSAKSCKEMDTIILDNNLPIVNVAGVPLLVKNKHSTVNDSNLVAVPSLQTNLRNLAIGVCTGKCVCLQGPVGCGKTAIVEHLAKLTHHECPTDFIKVQLGDQTDSKMLLGMYVCTDIPGEFVWQPGVLTQAVTQGKWLLLEDIDCAPLDVASVLSNLLETGTLSVPGHRDAIPVKSGFQLFVTQRLVSSSSGLRRKSPSGTSSLLERFWLYVNLEPLSREELVTVVQTLFPNLTTVATKMVNVFSLCTGEGENDVPKSGRLSSTRDLIKWCMRSSVDFDVSSPAVATKIFQNAIDIFCSAIPNQDERLKLSVAIGHTLGQTTSTAEYFGKNYKPAVLNTSSTDFTIGRTSLKRKDQLYTSQINRKRSKFSYTRPSACLLERVATCIAQREPVLLVGETGTGKTSSVQYLAQKLGHKLVVLNMNQQSESADLLGGYKPIDLKFYLTPIREEYEILFRSYFSVEPNKKFLSRLAKVYEEGRWKMLVQLMSLSSAKALENLEAKVKKHNSATDTEKKKTDLKWLKKWRTLSAKLDKLVNQVKVENSLAFTFIEGSLVKALKEGHWVLLDEINLANAETLECLSGLLEGASGSLSLLERGDKELIKRHPDFIIFACMNPATDVGKKELPVGLRNRFTEFFVDELTEHSDLQSLIATYLEDLNLPAAKLEAIVKLYLNIRRESMQTLCDGIGHKPHFSLRTLCRALNVAVTNPCGSVLRSLYEGFCLSFLTQLDEKSYPIVKDLISKAILKDTKTMKSVLGTPILKPQTNCINFEGYWIVQGELEPSPPDNYILTPMVRRNLKDLARIVSIGTVPVLLQGDTSVGKTSLITFLAKSSGHTCLRINNHEHTDLQEYVGSYVADNTGKLVFKEGILVEAMRKGHWIILDELNLAPSDVLEALNRVLDDNHELFIPETQTVVKAHKNFMLFATQNPPGLYGGRKVLSRAFRNRFVELHFDEIPAEELQVILHERCKMPDSYCKQIISVMKDLQVKRKVTDAFAGKKGFITLRDLFRWGERYRLAPETEGKLYDWSQHLADEGYLVLTAKVRKNEEVAEIRAAIKKHLRRDVEPQNLFNLHEKTSPVTKAILQTILEAENGVKGFRHIVWTYQMRRMAVLVMKSYQFKEPVLLVGETGGGKTTVCQLVSVLNSQPMHSINCHMHTESSDFLGNLRPVRDRREGTKLFEWVNGPLIEAMEQGGLFLADEISLADDSVLERLNSLLEPERSLLLTERGFDGIDSASSKDVIQADEKFFFIGTMNPGGDFGKKELSPALRNRFTEIWCASCTEREDLQAIAEHNLKLDLDVKKLLAAKLLDFVEWLGKTELGKKFVVSIRDVLSWVNFINVCTGDGMELKLSVSEAYLHGAFLTYLDGLGSGLTSSESSKKLDLWKESATRMLEDQLQELEKVQSSLDPKIQPDHSDRFGIPPFYIRRGPKSSESELAFTFEAKTTKSNMLKVLRALQLNKPILLEGSPGVGKTSLVSAIAKASGNRLLRINLSDQTDMSDLFGADLPVENGKAGEFAWRDGPFLRALQAGDWVLLDELNLASQSVLEGLNACFDHRGEIYIPELNKTFVVKPGTKFFACQNPLKQGGGRRGLPKSFLNRFAQVFVDVLLDEDLRFIIASQFPELDGDVVERMMNFNTKVAEEAGILWGHSGSPWEMNLRDVTRWCEVMVKESKQGGELKFNPGQFVELIYSDRMRTRDDKERVRAIFIELFGEDCNLPPRQPVLTATKTEYIIGDTRLKKNSQTGSCSDAFQDEILLLRDQLPVLRSLARCVEMNWMAILVGGSGSGKTSVVRALAHLSGQSLRSITVNSSMDTTEILGSFEQTDYNRHLEQLFEVTRDRLVSGLRTNLSTQNLKQLQLFHSKLEDEIFEQRESATMAEATDHFLRKADRLLELVQTMKTSEFEFELEDIFAKLEVLISLVKRDGCLNAGGKFEWVDSLLVKCLRDGSWLLVDQVNLCNPAVLDRLNGLLEPNGVLSIGERGVDSSGDVITIKPHKNFRLFLTMDPKYGEISRAMRNRGVEIYLLADKEHRVGNDLDLRSMLHNINLTRRRDQDVLMRIHREISDHPSTLETLTVSQILHAGFLIVQQIARGFPIREAFLSACNDVYLKARFISDRNTRQNFVEMMKEAIDDQVADLNEIWDPRVVPYEDVTVRLSKLDENSEVALMKQRGFILQWVIGTYKLQSSKKVQSTEFLDQFFDCNGRMRFNVNELVPYLVLQFYETSSLDLEIQRKWLDRLVKSSNVDQLKDVEKLNRLLADEVENFKFACQVEDHLPWDYEKFDTDDHRDANRLALLLHFCLMNYNRNWDRASTNQTITLLEYSQTVCEGKILSRTADYPLVTRFYSIVRSLKTCLHHLLNDFSVQVSNKRYALLRTGLLFFTKFEILGDTKLIKSTSSNNFVNVEEVSLLLKVYYKWLLKFVTSFINSCNENVMDSTCKMKVNEALTVVNEINVNLRSINDPFRKVSKVVKKTLFHVAPHSEDVDMKVHSKLLELDPSFEPWMTEMDNFSPKQSLGIVLKNSDELKNVIGTMIDLWKDVYLGNCKTQNSSECLEKVEEFINRVCPKVTREQTMEVDEKECAGIISDVELWPVYEFFFAIFALAQTENQPELLNMELFEDFKQVLSIPPSTLALLKIVGETDDVLLNSMSFYSLIRCFGKMKITKTDLLMLDNEKTSEHYKKIFINSLSGFNFMKFVVKFLLNDGTPDLISFNLSTASLGTCNLQFSNLQTLNELLWTNTASLNSAELSYKSNDLHVLKSQTCAFLSVMEKESHLIKEETDPKITEEMNRNFTSPLQKLTTLTNNLTEPDLSKQGESWFLLGYLQVFLFTNVGFIDPVHKVSLKLQNLEEDIDDAKKSVYVSLLSAKLYGQLKIEHPRMLELEKHLEKLTGDRKTLQRFKAVRPDNKEFLALCRVMMEFRSLLGKYEVVSNYVENLKSSAIVDSPKSQQVALLSIEEAIGWQESCQSFIDKIERLYLSGYPDIVVPILIGLSHMKHGLDILTDQVHRSVSDYSTKTNSLSLETFVYNLIRYPTIGTDQQTLLDLVELCTSNSSRQLLNQNLQDSSVSMQEQFRLTLSALREFHNQVILAERVTTKSWTVLCQLLHQVTLIWTKEQNKLKEQEEERNNLYRNKAAVHSEIKTEEEMIKEEMEYLFPTTREEDFGDIESKDKSVLGDTKKVPESVRKSVPLISQDHICEVQKIHSSIVTLFTSSLWLSRKPQGTVNYIEPLVQRFSTSNQLLSSAVLSSETSLKLCPSVNILTRFTSTSQGQDTESDKGTYDFYKDSNVEEVKRCIPILEQVLTRIKQLLDQWPEHPTLQSIVVIIKRVFSFPVTSPVFRFLTGLELLLVKMQEWEEIAHKGISLLDYSTVVTQQIISWRQYELGCWKECLNTAQERLRLNASRWWFHLYSMFEKYTRPEEEDSDEPAKLSKSLHKFMNESPLVEFEARLELLFTFHCHLCYALPTDKRNEMVSILWNLYNYYKLLVPQVNARISELKAPIQTGLKNFVKIARWNDISYWSVTETIHKTHKTLHSFIKKFETGLKESVAVCFFIKPSFVDAKESQRYQLKVEDYLVPVVVESSVQVVNEMECLGNVASKTRIAKRLCSETLQRENDAKVMEELQSFVEEFMELASQLKDTEVDRSLPKPAQKSRAKSILSQKKSSLARYFKDLKEFGVSDRKGILKLRNKEEEVICLGVPPLDLQSSLSCVRTRKVDEKLLCHWEGCDKYYYKSINLLNTLNTTSYSPQKGLSSLDIEKFKGFSADLMVMAHKQRVTLVNTWKHFVTLRKQLDVLSIVEPERGNQVKVVERSVGRLEELLVAAKTVFHQVAIYLQSCPRLVEGKRVFALVKVPLPVESCRKDDATWSNINKLVQQAMDLVNSMSKDGTKIHGLQVEESSPEGWAREKLLTSDHLTCLGRCCLKIDKLKTILKELEKFVSSNGDESHPLLSSLRFLDELIQQFAESYEATKINGGEREDTSLIQDFEVRLEGLLKRRLLIIQTKFKKEIKDGSSSSLSENLVRPISKDLRELKLEDFAVELNGLQVLLSEMSPRAFRHCVSQLSSCLNLFEQVLLMSEFYLTRQVATLRLTCKVLYLQLNVFLELATNGFCIPKDLDVDEEEGEEESQTSDKGGMGLAEGEGEKDVSERIESEDQLDEAQLPNQEKEKTDDSCKEEEKGINMSEDFEGDLQDLEKGEKDEDDEESEEESDNEDLDKQMNELGEGAEQLDEQIWGDDKDDAEDEPRENEDDVGKGEQIGDKQMDAKDDERKDDAKDDKTENDDGEEKEQPQKEINEMKEPEVNEDQVDPYHGQQKEEPEVEPLDLPDDLNLDDQEAKDNEEKETENPFDIDEMKEGVMPPEKGEPEVEEVEDKEKENEEEASSEDEEEQERRRDEPMDQEPIEEENSAEEGKEVDKEKKKEEGEDAETEEKEEGADEKALPSVDAPSNEKDASEQMEETSGSKDSVAQKPETEDVESSSESAQENNSDKGVGQSQSDNQTEGHSGSHQEQVSARVQQGNELPKNEKRKNPGQAEEDRSLVNEDDPVRKKLKTVILSDDKTSGTEEKDVCEEKESDAYQHVADSEQCDQHAMDAATEDQLRQKPALDEEEQPVDENGDVEMAEEDQVPEKDAEAEELSSEKVEHGEKKSGKSKNSERKDQLEGESEKVEIDGEVVEMSTVARSAESNFFTNLLTEDSSLSTIPLEQRRVQMSNLLQQWSSTPTTEEASQAWNTLNSMVDFSARDLSEKLRLILEPTQASRLKGDYRTGRRINMRKIIPYIASQFRKDKIWLRRTKPSKRDYQIVIAIDDSSSMADNHSKELAFESLALISKALTYLESGDLSIVSFGETTNILHPLGEPFTERNGSYLMQELKFEQKRTMIARMLNATMDMFESQPGSQENAKLLVILSDGRGAFSEGRDTILRSVRRAKLSDVFIVFVIVDNPKSKDSILDIRLPVVRPDGSVKCDTYMDNFPFPFYIILRDVNQLTDVLSDALRQWFELIGTAD